MNGKPTLVEYHYSRDVFGNDQSAINRHSIRVYKIDNRTFVLDRTLDGVPPFYQLTETIPGRFLAKTIPINDKDYWGDGISWRNAEAAVIKELGASTIKREKAEA